MGDERDPRVWMKVEQDLVELEQGKGFGTLPGIVSDEEGEDLGGPEGIAKTEQKAAEKGQNDTEWEKGRENESPK